MSVQRSVTLLFLLLLSLSVVQLTVDRAAAHLTMRHQWRAVHEYHTAGRVPQRPTLEAPAGWSVVLLRTGAVVVPDPPDVVVPMPRAVFVPPRV
jgi:hypothetical protein